MDPVSLKDARESNTKVPTQWNPHAMANFSEPIPKEVTKRVIAQEAAGVELTTLPGSSQQNPQQDFSGGPSSSDGWQELTAEGLARMAAPNTSNPAELAKIADFISDIDKSFATAGPSVEGGIPSELESTGSQESTGLSLIHI